MEYSRLLKQCTLILFLAALMHSTFAQQQHGILPITTTETSYTLVDNSYTDGDTTTGVRLSFEAPKTGIFNVTFTPVNSSYYLYKCADNTFASCGSILRVLSGTTPWTETFFAGNGQSTYYKITEYDTTSSTLPFNVVYEEIDSYVVTFNAKDTAITVGSSLSVSAVGLLGPDEAFIGWKVGPDSTAGTFANDKAMTTTFTPATDAEISIDKKTVLTHSLTSTPSSFTYDADGYQNVSSNYAVRTYFSAADSGDYVLIVRKTYTNYIYKYGTDASFSTSTSQACGTAFCKIPFSSKAGERSYFELVQMAETNIGDTVTVSVEKAAGVYADTVGSGIVRVDGNANYNLGFVAGDTVLITATDNLGSKFSHWEKISGNCTIIDSTTRFTNVVVNSECHVRATFVPGVIYSVTTKEKDYVMAKNYYSRNPSEGVRFMFVAPNDGSFAVRFMLKDSAKSFIVTQYPTSAFNSAPWSGTFLQTKTDSVYMSKGDTVFYIVKPTVNEDSILEFTASYSTLKSYTVTLTSSSPQCSTSVVSESVPAGLTKTYLGYAVSGFRPAGFKITKGDGTITQDYPSSMTLKVNSNIKLKLQCDSANLIDITTREKYYSANKDYYEIGPSAGLRFRYVAPNTALYLIRAKTKLANGSYFNGTYYNYGLDPLFTTYNYGLDTALAKAPYSLGLGNRDQIQNYVVEPAKKGEEHFFRIIPSNASYFDDSIAVFAVRASIVDVEGKTKLDTIAYGDSLPVTTTIDTGRAFVCWKLDYGTGKFKDSSLISTMFVPSSDSAKVAVKTRKGKVYTLTDKFSRFSYFADGTQLATRYGIRAVHTAKSAGLYMLVMQSDKPWIHTELLNDSTFTSAGTANSHTITSYKGKTEVRVLFDVATADTSNYYLFLPYDNMYLKDSILVKIERTAKLRSDTVGGGYVRVNGTTLDYDSTHIAGDTLTIAATANPDQKFDRWEKASGKCTFIDSTKRTTRVVLGGDCKVRAVFRSGTFYPITATPTAYTAEEHYFVESPTRGVRFKFVAPDTGAYVIVTSWANTRDFSCRRSADSTFASSQFYRSSSAVTADSMWLAKDSVVYVMVVPAYAADTSRTFWISYATSRASLTLTADTNGTVSPVVYDPAWIGPKYPIKAVADSGYRFDSWDLISGSATIDDKNAPFTMASVKKQSGIIAHFKKGSIHSLSTSKKTFNYVTHYYSDITGNTVYFTWTPPDTAWYMIHIESADGMAAKWYEFGRDTSFLSMGVDSVVPSPVQGTSSIFLFRGEPKKKLYWALVDSLNTEILDKEFTIQVVTPYVLTVISDAKGRVNPIGNVGVFPGSDTAISVIPYGGYVFDKWVKVSGKMTISDSTSKNIRVKPITSTCEIMATYTLDLSAEPEVDITNLDLASFPGICVDVTVKDKNTDRSIAGLDSSDFVLFHDKKGQPLQVSSVENTTGVSVAIVVDESGSMAWDSYGQIRIEQAKESIRQFIYEMSQFDRAAIVGFVGSGNGTILHQAMTSDKKLLLEAVDALRASGGTNIRDGAYSGLEQIVGETNPTAVIVFSDGADGGNSVTPQQVIDYAKSLNTVVHSVAIGENNLDPLKTMSDGTGGSYTFAPSADQLAAIYISIRNNIQSKYTICYESPDTTIDGDEHQIIVKTKFLNKTASDTVYWNEGAMPPVITLTKDTKKLIGVKQPEGDSITISVYVTSQDSIASVMLYKRTSSPNTSMTYTAYPMVHVKDSLWQFVIADTNVVYPGIDFYVIAMNASGMVGKSPQVPTPSNEPYTIPVGNEAPKVTYEEVDCVDTLGGEGTFSFEIKDADDIASAKLYYRPVGSVVFKEKKMSRESKKGNDWSVSISPSVMRPDGVEFYVRVVDKKGVSVRWETFSNNKVLACRDTSLSAEDVPDSIWIKNGEKEGKQITRLTNKIKLAVKTENFSNDTDTVTASLSCLVSGDVEDNLKLVEVSNGFYESKKALEKNEYGVKKNDGKISCAEADTMVATYKDPLYGSTVRDTVIFADDVKTEYRFMDANCKTDLDSVETSTSAKFCLKIQASSPSLYVADTLKLTLFTDQGDTLRVKAIETGVYSKQYLYKGSFYFAEDSASLKDSLLDAVLDLDTTFNRVVIQGGISSDKSKLRKRDSLVVFTNYVAADVAEMYDADLDGKADSVRIHFKKPLKKKISSIDTVFWNKAKGSWTTVDTKKIRITEDSTWAEAKVHKPFKYGLTALDKSNAPYLRVTKDKSEFSQKTMLVDKVGAVPLKAVKRPGQITMEEYLDASDEVAPDTLEITMSENIKNTGKKSAWKDLFRYSKSCGDTVDYPIRTNSDPFVDSTGRVWKFVLADYAVMKGYCITTNPKATYTDEDGNSMGRGGVEIEGRDETVYLYEVSAVQPVHGIGKKGKWIPQGGDSWEEVPDSLTVVKVSSVAPYEANIFIYDNLANVVANMKQKFGYNGEMEENIRGNDKNRAKIGYLSWNHRSNRDRKVGTGVYIWRIDFKFKDGHTEYRILKTGYMRREE